MVVLRLGHMETGLVVHRSIDPETWDGRYAYAGTAKDGGGWFSLLYESETAEISQAEFDETASDWSTRLVWSEADQSAQQYAMPQGLRSMVTMVITMSRQMLPRIVLCFGFAK